MCMDNVHFTVCNHLGRIPHANHKCRRLPRAGYCFLPIYYHLAGTLPPTPCHYPYSDSAPTYRVEGWCSQACRQLYAHLPLHHFNGATPEVYLREERARRILEARRAQRHRDRELTAPAPDWTSAPKDRRNYREDREEWEDFEVQIEFLRRWRTGVRTPRGEVLLEKTASRGAKGEELVWTKTREEVELIRQARRERMMGNRTGLEDGMAARKEVWRGTRDKKSKEWRATERESRIEKVREGPKKESQKSAPPEPKRERRAKVGNREIRAAIPLHEKPLPPLRRKGLENIFREDSPPPSLRCRPASNPVVGKSKKEEQKEKEARRLNKGNSFPEICRSGSKKQEEKEEDGHISPRRLLSRRNGPKLHVDTGTASRKDGTKGSGHHIAALKSAIDFIKVRMELRPRESCASFVCADAAAIERGQVPLRVLLGEDRI